MRRHPRTFEQLSERGKRLRIVVEDLCFVKETSNHE